ncbi:MAG: hypothetical protein M1371_11735 [Actinobacteria bacterium]|nr:hypothetical protein [Actinomycetota bacterium]
MNTRELFIETMKFNRKVRSLKWEFGYWGETVKNWYQAGLPRNNPPIIDTRITTPTSSLYKAVWPHGVKSKDDIPNGIAVVAGGLYWPTQGFPMDRDVRDYFGMDKCQILVDVNYLFCPQFEPKIEYEDDRSIVYVDIDGVKRRFLKQEAVIPAGMDWPIKDWKSWLELKEERLNLENVSKRFPKNWPELLNAYKNRDYPLALGGYPQGFFGTLSHLMGYENLFYAYFDRPDLVHDVLNTFTEIWIAVWSEVIAQIDVDLVHIWEDISFGRGSMVSPQQFKEFISPYYRRVTDFLKSRGVGVILVDTDGDCNELIPLFIETGITGMYPFEASAGMDIVKVRKLYPDLQMLGGIPKSEIALGRKRIDEILEPITWMLKQGGYIPFGDHLIPPEVPWDNFRYYREKLNRIIESK